MWFYFHIFPGHAGSDVLLVTKDDELLVFGFNSSRCLSVEDHRCQYNSVSLNKIEELSKKRIKGDDGLKNILFFILYVL